MAFTIRAATPSDLASIASLDIAAHQPNSAILNMNLLPAADIHTLWLSHFTHFLSQPDHYQFLVAVTPEGDIAGFLVGAYPNLQLSEGDEWNPKFPENTDVEKLQWFKGLMKTMKEDKMKYFKSDMWELEALATSPSYQKRGVASLLLNHWFQEVDAAHGTTYVRASLAGRGLYEKLGCVNKGVHSFDVSDRGWDQPIVNTNMIREKRQ